MFEEKLNKYQHPEIIVFDQKSLAPELKRHMLRYLSVTVTGMNMLRGLRRTVDCLRRVEISIQNGQVITKIGDKIAQE